MLYYIYSIVIHIFPIIILKYCHKIHDNYKKKKRDPYTHESCHLRGLRCSPPLPRLCLSGAVVPLDRRSLSIGVDYRIYCSHEIL